MKLIHYSAEPLGRPYSVQQTAVGPKPKGLWLSIEGDEDWKSWCDAQQFGLDRMRYSAVVSLRPAANILMLTSAGEIDAFDDRFGGNLYGSIRYIDWVAVSAVSSGIIIAPYIWSRRLDGRACHWYYGWDCASGCIWNADAIERVDQYLSVET